MFRPLVIPFCPCPRPCQKTQFAVAVEVAPATSIELGKKSCCYCFQLAELGTPFFQKNVPFFLFFSVLYKSTIRSFRSFPFKKENVPFFSISVRKRTKRTKRSFEKNGCPTLPNCILLEESEHQLTTKKGGGNWGNYTMHLFWLGLGTWLGKRQVQVHCKVNSREGFYADSKYLLFFAEFHKFVHN